MDGDSEGKNRLNDESDGDSNGESDSSEGSSTEDDLDEDDSRNNALSGDGPKTMKSLSRSQSLGTVPVPKKSNTHNFLANVNGNKRKRRLADKIKEANDSSLPVKSLFVCFGF